MENVSQHSILSIEHCNCRLHEPVFHNYTVDDKLDAPSAITISLDVTLQYSTIAHTLFYVLRFKLLILNTYTFLNVTFDNNNKKKVTSRGVLNRVGHKCSVFSACPRIV